MSPSNAEMSCYECAHLHQRDHPIDGQSAVKFPRNDWVGYCPLMKQRREGRHLIIFDGVNLAASSGENGRWVGYVYSRLRLN